MISSFLAINTEFCDKVTADHYKDLKEYETNMIEAANLAGVDDGRVDRTKITGRGGKRNVIQRPKLDTSGATVLVAILRNKVNITIIIHLKYEIKNHIIFYKLI